MTIPASDVDDGHRQQEPSVKRPPATLWWEGDVDGRLALLDQTRLPLELHVARYDDVPGLVEAIRSLRVRGAPAIGLAAAYGVCLAARGPADEPLATLRERLADATRTLAASRPTAVNLFWALRQTSDVVDRFPADGSALDLRRELLATAHRLLAEDRRICQAIGRHGAELLRDGDGVLTHCNAGGLATAADGTALAVIFAAHEAGKNLRVWVDETRPLLQGARLTAWELVQRRIPATLICDNMAAQVMREGKVRCVIVGADRIAANGDVANKIGTYGLAVLAAAHGVPFYVAAPVSTLDPACPSGDQIPIEQRASSEITDGFGRATAPRGVDVYNPAFDVTPAKYLTGLVTEFGVTSPVDPDTIARLLSTARESRPS